MSLIKEPLNVDFVVESRPLTTAEEKAIREFIKADKENRLSDNRVLLKKRGKQAEKTD